MKHRTNKTFGAAIVASTSGVVPSSAAASGVGLYEAFLLPGLALGFVFCLVFLTVPSLRRMILRIPSTANSFMLFVFAAFAIGYAAVSVLLGKTTMGSGIVFQAIEPLRFWQLIAVQAGAGVGLLVLGFLQKGQPWR
jgi:uncharacterized RDD family membrane protein YckC